jgi:hypothetical protein
MRSPLSGAPCDTEHPFPAPTWTDWIDSMEYGALQRRETRHGMQDVDTTPTWRLFAANMWEAPCYNQHVTEVAADPFLVTHLCAVAVHVGLPRNPMIYVLALEQVGAGPTFNALHDGGLEAGREAVEQMSDDSRRKTVMECVALVLHGWTGLRLDLHDGVIAGKRIQRGN